MNCENFDRQLDAWLDTELPASRASELEAHAAGCAACRRVFDTAREMQRGAFALPARRQPSRDLWPEIAAQLAPRQRNGRQRNSNWLRTIAATVAVMAVFGGGMLADRVLQENDRTGERLQVEGSRDRRLPSVADARRILPASHVELIEGSGSGLQRTAEQDLLRNLLVVNLAIRRVESAVEQEPSNPNLRELLADLYARENRILIEAERQRVEQQSSTGLTRTGI